MSEWDWRVIFPFSLKNWPVEALHIHPLPPAFTENRHHFSLSIKLILCYLRQLAHSECGKPLCWARRDANLLGPKIRCLIFRLIFDSNALFVPISAVLTLPGRRTQLRFVFSTCGIVPETIFLIWTSVWWVVDTSLLAFLVESSLFGRLKFNHPVFALQCRWC